MKMAIPDLVYIDRAVTGATALHCCSTTDAANFTQSFSAEDSVTSLRNRDLMGNGHVDIGYVLGANPAAGGTGIIVRIDAGLGNGTFVSHQAVIPGPNSFNDSFNFFATGRLTQGGPLDLIAEDTTTNTLLTFHANPTPAAGQLRISGRIHVPYRHLLARRRRTHLRRGWETVMESRS